MIGHDLEYINSKNDEVIRNEIPTVNFSHKSSALYIFQIFIIDLSSASEKQYTRVAWLQ